MSGSFFGGGLSPFEWIVPPVALGHKAYNATAQQVSPRAKINAPGSKNANKADADERARIEQKRLGDAQTEAARVAEEERVDALPENVRKRAGAAASSLGLTGSKRPSASSYLSGVSA